jgi:hypothetical protein
MGGKKRGTLAANKRPSQQYRLHNEEPSMHANVKKVMAAGIVALGLTAGSAQATFINGSVGVSDAGITLSNLPGSMVSQLLTVTLGSSVIAPCAGDLASACAASPAGATTMTIPLTAPGGMTVQFITGAFTWNILLLTSITRTAPTNDTGLVSDQLALIGFGTVDGPGFQQTLARLAFGASGSCNEASPGSTNCEAGTETATWQGTLSARGTAVSLPEPGVLALLGLGLGLAALSLRRRKIV